MIFSVSTGEGGTPNVLIKTETGATVTLSKGDIVLTKIAENGEALFESVEYGTWTAVATLDDNTATQQIEVPQTIEQEVTLGLMLSSLPLKTTKLKIGGIKWVLFARDHEGYPDGAQTLINEYADNPGTFGTGTDYDQSNLKTKMAEIYDGFTANEKSKVLVTSRKYLNSTSTYTDFEEQVFPLSVTELGGTANEYTYNLGFNSNEDRKLVTEEGGARNYWAADAFSSSAVWSVTTAGAISAVAPTNANYVARYGCNLSANTVLNEYPDEEGYYTIYREVNTASDLLVGDKVKIGGAKYYVITKDHEGYPTNAVTLISEYVIQTSAFGSNTNYATSTIKSLCEQYYNQLSTAEQNAIVETTRKYKNASGAYPQSSEYIFLLNSVEIGGSPDAQMGFNLGFTSNDDRICRDEGGTAQYWWLGDVFSSTEVWYVSSRGTTSGGNPSTAYGVRPALNLSPTAPIAAMDSDGYYSIVGADTVSTLKDKSLEILGVKL